jgi:hypothetical protein
MKVSQLLAVPITPERLPSAVVSIVIDLSKVLRLAAFTTTF